MTDPGYPAGADSDPNAPWHERAHYKACPCHEDQPEAIECPECTCAEMAKDEASERADAKNDALRDRELDP